MPVIPDLPWTAQEIGAGPGVVYLTHLHLRRLRDVPAFLRDSMAIRTQTMRSPGARSLTLRAQPLARRFTTVSCGTTSRRRGPSSAPIRTGRR